LPGPLIVDQIERLAPLAIRRRANTPALIRNRPVPGDDLPPGSTLGDDEAVASAALAARVAF
jgi:hypothetical protein